MEFWIAIFGAVVVLCAQWAMISLVALGALRRRVQVALRDLRGPMQHYLEEGAAAAGSARGFGAAQEVLRGEREAREQVEAFLAGVEGRPMEEVDLEGFRKAWAGCLKANQAVDEGVSALPCVVEGWAGLQADLQTRRERVTQALLEYNSAVGAYRNRWRNGATSAAGRWFGYGPLKEWSIAGEPIPEGS